MDKISCIILAGGESKRFGEDKAFFNFNGVSFLERALGAAMEISDDIVICAREESKIKDCRVETENVSKKRAEAGKKKIIPAIIFDDTNCGFKGPLKGIYSSIKNLERKFVLVMECDAPFFNAEAVKELIKKAKSENAQAVVPLWPDSTIEPLLACYETEYARLILDMLHNYALNLKEDFLFNDSVNLSRFLPSVYYYNIFDMIKNNRNLKPDIFININSKKDLEEYAANKKTFNKGSAQSIKIKKRNRFYDLKNPRNKPYGKLAKALYYWWVYAKTKNYLYLGRSFKYFKEDSSVYSSGGLNFMGDKIIKLIPNPFGILK